MIIYSLSIFSFSINFCFSRFLAFSFFIKIARAWSEIFGIFALPISYGIAWKAWFWNISSILGYLPGELGVEFYFLTIDLFFFLNYGVTVPPIDGPLIVLMVGLLKNGVSSSEKEI